MQIAIAQYSNRNSKPEKSGHSHEFLKKNSFRTTSNYPKLIGESNP